MRNAVATMIATLVAWRGGFTEACFASTSSYVGVSRSGVSCRGQVEASIEAYVRRGRASEAKEAEDIVSRILCPLEEERQRNEAGMEAFEGAARGGEAISNDDPRNQFTYGEFPFQSFDVLLDRATAYLPSPSRQKQVLVDVGSGSGRLVFYAALTRPLQEVHGMEIGPRLHALAANSLSRGLRQGYFTKHANTDKPTTTTMLALHNGNVLLQQDPYFSDNTNNNNNDRIADVLSTATILFAYSTVWETDPLRPFDTTLQAMILSPQWSQTLANLCPNNCVAITTDRALNPNHGWKFKESLQVDNPSVWGSNCFISRLEK